VKRFAHILLRIAAVLASGMLLASACDIADSVIQTGGDVWNIVETWA
jgi:hypothetical protein